MTSPNVRPPAKASEATVTLFLMMAEPPTPGASESRSSVHTRREATASRIPSGTSSAAVPGSIATARAPPAIPAERSATARRNGPRARAKARGSSSR